MKNSGQILDRVYQDDHNKTTSKKKKKKKKTEGSSPYLTSNIKLLNEF